MSDVDKRRIESEYFSFTATGVSAVDDVLEAVAQAGKSYHHTQSWSDNDYGPSCAEQIQAAADRLSTALTEVARERDALRERETAHLLALNSARSVFGLIEGGQELLATAIKAGDPQHELLFRVNEDRERAAHAGRALDASLDSALGASQ